MTKRTVQDAIKQTRPFRDLRQEATVALLLTTDAVRRRFEDFFAAHGAITMQQYNVLRILRGSEPRGLPTLEIGVRMLERTPGVTRLVDRLVDKRLVQRERGDDDRRQIVCRITRAGLQLLASLDPGMDRLDHEVLACLDEPRLRTLLGLLDQVRLHQDPSAT